MRKEGLEPSHPVWKQVPETCASTISPLSQLSFVAFRQRAPFYTLDGIIATYFLFFFMIMRVYLRYAALCAALHATRLRGFYARLSAIRRALRRAISLALNTPGVFP